MSAPGELRPSAGVVAKGMGGGAVLIHLHTNRIFELNATAARIWSLLEQGAARDAICAQLREEFSVDPEDVASTVDSLLSELAREGLVGV